MPPLYEFLDRQNLLDGKFTRNGDSIHLGNVGISKFVRVMKESIYNREHNHISGVSRSGQQVDSRRHSAGSTRPA